MGKINGVHHIALKPKAEIFTKVADFYMNVLGCTVKREWGQGETKSYMLSCGDNTVMEILHGDDDGSVKVGSFNHVAFAVDEVENFIEEIRGLGYEITMEPKTLNITPDYPVQVAFFIGPVGETVELFKEL